MKDEHLPNSVIDTFAYYYEKVVKGNKGLLFDSDLQAVSPDEIGDADEVGEYFEAGNRALKHTVRIVLNGGLGTSMGLTGPKSLLVVKNGKSFLELILNRASHKKVQLALMNSYSTNQATESAIRRINPANIPLSFLQNKFPKILQSDLSPAQWPDNPLLEWNPPGHGDIYAALYASGMLQNFLDQGIYYAFISNSDNLGAQLDESILGYFVENQFPFMNEVAEKTPEDNKGGHLARYKNGRLILRETAQCPENEIEAFQDITHYRFFNTNNIWVNLNSLKKEIENQGMFKLPMIINPKKLDPKDKTSPPVFQIETAMGAAVFLFEGATAIKVPRSRFFPVKTCNDLLSILSDCYIYNDDDDKLELNPLRKPILPKRVKIKLDPAYYGSVDQLNARFSDGVPSLVNCKSLTIEGDVAFEKNVRLEEEVLIKNTQKSQALVKEGTCINKNIIF